MDGSDHQKRFKACGKTLPTDHQAAYVVWKQANARSAGKRGTTCLSGLPQ